MFIQEFTLKGLDWSKLDILEYTVSAVYTVFRRVEIDKNAV